MLEKDPDDRMTIDDVLALPIITEHAATYLPKDVFAVEFPISNRNMLVGEKKVVVKPGVELPVAADVNGYVKDTRALYKRDYANFGRDLSGEWGKLILKNNIVVEFSNFNHDIIDGIDWRNLWYCKYLNLCGCDFVT